MESKIKMMEEGTLDDNMLSSNASSQGIGGDVIGIYHNPANQNDNDDSSTATNYTVSVEGDDKNSSSGGDVNESDSDKQELSMQDLDEVISSASLIASKRPSILPSLVRRPLPKTRIKLSIRSIPPTLANRKSIPKPKVAESQALPEVINQKNDDNSSDDDSIIINATVADSDDAEGDDDDDVVASVAVPSYSSMQGNPTEDQRSREKGSTPKSLSLPPKRRNPPGSKAVRMPLISSPALLMSQPAMTTTATSSASAVGDKDLPISVTSSNTKKAASESKVFVTPASVFDYSMEMAGYTVESRAKNHHRGSSVKRVVGDMFDSDVALTRRFPDLLPQELLERVTDGTSLPKLLIDSIPRKRQHCMFAEMCPISLTIPYPDDYVQKRIAYYEQVNERELAIERFQESLEDTADEAVPNEKVDFATPRSLSPTNDNSKKIVVPRIPDPPSPPRIENLVNFSSNAFKDQHPLYPPRREDFVNHLDPKAFHITEGRYFGLSTNMIADPNFIGPNAPGLMGLPSGSVLSTSSAGGGAISGAMILSLATTYNGVTAGTSAALKSSSLAPGSQPVSSSYLPVVEPDEEIPKYQTGPEPTATLADLKEIMDQDNEASAIMKKHVIRAAVRASRSGLHHQYFLGTDGNVYPSISQVFNICSGIKPCHRCKVNKLQAYHCRLRRRHKETDYDDGAKSFADLEPLFEAPMDTLRDYLSRQDHLKLPE